MTEQEFARLVKRRDTDAIERVMHRVVTPQQGGEGVSGSTSLMRPVKEQVRGLQTPSAYRSKWEAAYANKLEMEKRTSVICNYWYEPFSLWLPGKVRYKPDFLVQYFPTGHTVNRPGFVTTLEIVEVKGWSKNRRDGMTRLKIAAALFPCFVWRMVWMKKGGGFDGTYV